MEKNAFWSLVKGDKEEHVLRREQITKGMRNRSLRG